MITTVYYDREHLSYDKNWLIDEVCNFHKHEEPEVFVNSINNELQNKPWFDKCILKKNKIEIITK